MLAYRDESGDPGREPGRGSSRFFVVALVVFSDREEAARCDKRIALLRPELGLPERFEFHFRDNSHRQRLAFLQAVAPYDFFYHAVIVDKEKLVGSHFTGAAPLYKYVCGLVFVNALPHLRRATVVIDGRAERRFRQQLQSYFRERMAEQGGRDVIAKLRIERSSSSNLVQLADYVAGIINRHALAKKGADEYRRWIAAREASCELWPK